MLLVFRPTEIKLNGTSIFGKVGEVSLSLKRKFVEQGAQGLPWDLDVPIPGKFEKPEAKIQWKGAPPTDVIKTILSTNNFIKVEFTDRIWGVTETQGLALDEDFSVRIHGWFKGIPDVQAKEENWEGETEIAVVFVELTGTRSGLSFAVGVEGVMRDELNLIIQGV